MASDIHTLLAETLDDRAGGDVDPAPLMRGAMAKGRRIHRRRMLAGGATLVAVAVLGTVAVAFPGLHRDSAPAVSAPGVPLTGRSPLLPVAMGQPGAAARPDLIGADPRILHFSVDGFAGTARKVSWSVERDSEWAEVSGDTFEAQVSIGRSRDELHDSPYYAATGPVTGPLAVQVGGRPGELRSWPTARPDGRTLSTVEWQPTAGFWAQATTWSQSSADAGRVAGLVRFDGAQRCALPFVLTWLPPGAAVRSCTVKLSVDGGARYFQGTLNVRNAGWEVQVRGSAAPALEAYTKGLTIGPYRAQRASDGGYAATISPYAIEVGVVPSESRPPDGQLRGLLAGVRLHGTWTDPHSW